jgi:hypothetical protein
MTFLYAQNYKNDRKETNRKTAHQACQGQGEKAFW